MGRIPADYERPPAKNPYRDLAEKLPKIGKKIAPKIEKLVDTRTPYRKFEDYIEERLKQDFPGYEIKPQHHSRTVRNRTDFFLHNPEIGDKLTVEAKHVLRLTKEHIDQASNQYPRYPKSRHLYIPKDTKVSDAVEEYAEKKNITVHRARVTFH